MALSGPRKAIRFDFVGQMPILTERSYFVTLKTMFFKNIDIQLELLYCFEAKFRVIESKSQNFEFEKILRQIDR